MEILVILAPFLMELFKNCQEQDNMGRAQRIKRGGPLVRGRVRRSLKASGLRKKELKSALNTAMEDIGSASVLEIKEGLDEMEEVASGL
jgi:hypothetical protein